MSLPNLDNNNNNDNSDSKKKHSGLPAFDMPEINKLPEFPSLPKMEDDFEEVPIDDIDDFEDAELNKEVYATPSPVKTELPIIEKEPEEIDLEEDYNPDYENDLKSQDEIGTEYIDVKEKRIIPIGGKRSKRTVKSSEFDSRNNTLAFTKVLRLIVMILLVILFLFGLKNTFFPSHVYSDDQIRSFAREGAGQTGFPKERGEAFVESFMEAYLTFGKDIPQNREILNYYYGEDTYSQLGSDKLKISTAPEAKQHIIISPKVYETILLTDYSALFKVNAYVSDTDGTEESKNRSTGRWLSFAINVYYDSNSESMAITKDSPTLIPTYRISKQNIVPADAPIGNGRVNEEILPALTPTINGFVKAYAKASIASHEEILQYIADKDDINLYDGFGGSVELSGDLASSIKKTVYDSDDGLFRVSLEIKWIDKAASQGPNKVEYTSKYIMRIEAIGEGRYVVTSFKPYNFYAQ